MNASVERQGLPLIIITYRDVFQTASKERGLDNEYQQRSATVWMSPSDLKQLGVEEGAMIKLVNTAASIVVQAKLEPSLPPGFGGMPVSPYAAKLISYEPAKTKLPNFKRIEVVAEPTDEGITSVSDLGNPCQGGGTDD